jgi:hypothetical protein
MLSAAATSGEAGADGADGVADGVAEGAADGVDEAGASSWAGDGLLGTDMVLLTSG